ncbi:MAG TPA: Spy/CpxP family protein refolding chaperone [Rubrivivax sp.]|nr:Spy/CpxP family protein refolding chaperone [Rubrivivax sp.]
MKPTTTFAAVVLATLSLAAANAAFAHPGMGMGPGMGHGMGPGMGQHAGPGMRHSMGGPETAAVAQARLPALKAELKITAAQESAWAAYAGVVQQQAEQREATRTQMQTRMHDPKLSDAERTALRESMLKTRDQHLAARTAALKDLQAVLTPEQRAIADSKLQPMRGHRMAMRGMGR